MLNMDSLLLMPLRERILLQPRMKFDLMGRRHDLGFLQQALQLGLGEVRHADRAAFA